MTWKDPQPIASGDHKVTGHDCGDDGGLAGVVGAGVVVSDGGGFDGLGGVAVALALAPGEGVPPDGDGASTAPPHARKPAEKAATKSESERKEVMVPNAKATRRPRHAPRIPRRKRPAPCVSVRHARRVTKK